VASRKYETVTLPLGETPKGARWAIQGGNHLMNTWKRTKAKKRQPTTDQLADRLRAMLRAGA
jgi:hypothetical protein